MANIGDRKRGIISSGSSVGQRGINTPNGGFDPDAAAFFAAVESEGGTLSSLEKSEYNDHVTRDTYDRTKVKREYPYRGGVINSCRIDAITLGLVTNNNFLDADADATGGLQPDGSTKWLIDSDAGSIFTSVNDVQVAHFIDAPGGGNSTFVGAHNTSTGNSLLLLETAGDSRFASGDVAIAAITVVPVNNAAVSGGRFTSTDLRIWVDEANEVQNTTSNALGFPAETLYIFARNRNGAANTPSGAKGLGTIMAEGMTPAEFLAYQTSFKTFLTNTGTI